MDDRNCNLKKKLRSQDEFINYGLGFHIFECLKKYNTRILQYLADTDETDTYGEVLTRSIRTALKIKEKGITRDDIISICSHNHKYSIVPFIASLFLGVKATHYDPNLSHLDTIHLLKLIQPRMMFVSMESLSFMEKCLEESEVNTELVVFGESKKYSVFSDFLTPNEEEDTFRPVIVDDIKETALILFSSGTTGLPKGICLSHYSLLRQGSSSMTLWTNTGPSISLVYTTLYWISALGTLLECITNGNSRVVCKTLNPASTWSLIDKYKVTSIFLAPYHVRDILAARQKNAKTGSLKVFLTGGTPVTAKLMKGLSEALPSANIIQAYGQTEASGFISSFNFGDDPKNVELQMKKPLSCGKVLPEYNWKIVDPITEEILGPDQKGEFRYKSEYQMNGYYKMDSASAFDSEGYIKTGDIAYYDEEDCLYVVDRIKEMFKYKGWHILPAVLEGVLANHPAIKEAVVVGIPHELDGDHPMGIVVLNKGYEDVAAEDIELYVQQKVPDTQRLRAGVVIVKEIEKTATGKIKRKQIKEKMLSGEFKSVL